MSHLTWDSSSQGLQLRPLTWVSASASAGTNCNVRVAAVLAPVAQLLVSPMQTGAALLLTEAGA